MINWHASTCRRPDLRFLPGLEAQACFNCGEIETVAESSSANVARNFDLRWPTSLPFIDDAADDNGPVGPPSLISSASNSAVEGVVLETTTAATDIGKDTTALAKTSLYTSLYARKIRLLRLLPGKYNDPITCDIRVVDLQSKPEYEALSYTWADSNGDTSLSETLHIKGHHSILRIITNCAKAIRRLRFPSLSRELWVDAICINQDNNAERSHQVGIMQYIYAAAERVLVYLGEETGDPDPETFVPWKYENQGNTLDLSTDLRKQPYFTRVLVIQEIASARSAWILLGAKGARWDDFLQPPDTDDIDYRSMCIMNYEFLKAHHPWLQLVSQPRHRKLKELCSFLFATERC
ncbi:hypothetical protein CCHR01_06648 [Colletotrichum chrysophilum]|uniref:Heterokaryon incompatibility domain-containing protein n=1 Tax=Colletotrichum chrysophilum TaxID=1836956 RepID=A0AAD9APF8_9PEZI|nr:hypothetical protein CCHR01_06648 [Colletotrichum chrysophilum]